MKYVKIIFNLRIGNIQVMGMTVILQAQRFRIYDANVVPFYWGSLAWGLDRRNGIDAACLISNSVLSCWPFPSEAA